MTEPTEAEIEAAARTIKPYSFTMRCSIPDCQECARDRDAARKMARAALTAAAQVRAQTPQSSDLQIQRLYEALKGAAYYIDRLEKVQQRRVVRDMCEAMEYYRRVGPPLIAAYEREELAGAGLMPIYSATEDQG